MPDLDPALTVACPACKAQRGQPCRSYNAVSVHQARYRALRGLERQADRMLGAGRPRRPKRRKQPKRRSAAARKARLEAEVRHDLAPQHGGFMTDVPDDVVRAEMARRTAGGRPLSLAEMERRLAAPDDSMNATYPARTDT